MDVTNLASQILSYLDDSGSCLTVAFTGSRKTKNFNSLDASNLNKSTRHSKDNPLFIYLLLIFRTLPPEKDL